jgi:hypothetical protein
LPTPTLLPTGGVGFSAIFRSKRIYDNLNTGRIDLPEGGVVEAANRLGSSF